MKCKYRKDDVLDNSPLLTKRGLGELDKMLKNSPDKIGIQSPNKKTDNPLTPEKGTTA